MTWACGLGRVIADTFIAQQIPVIINPCPHHASFQGDIVHRGQFIQTVVDKTFGALPANLATIDNRASTPMGGLFHDQNGCTTGGRRARGL